MKIYLSIVLLIGFSFGQDNEIIYATLQDTTFKIRSNGLERDVIMPLASISDVSEDQTKFLFTVRTNDSYNPLILFYDSMTIDTLDVIGFNPRFSSDENFITYFNYSYGYDNAEESSKLCKYSLVDSSQTVVQDFLAGNQIGYKLSHNRQKILFAKYVEEQSHSLDSVDIMITDMVHNETQFIKRMDYTYGEVPFYWDESGYLYFVFADTNGTRQLFKMHEMETDSMSQLTFFEDDCFLLHTVDTHLEKLILNVNIGSNLDRISQFWVYNVLSNELVYLDEVECCDMGLGQAWSSDNSKVGIATIWAWGMPGVGSLKIYDISTNQLITDLYGYNPYSPSYTFFWKEEIRTYTWHISVEGSDSTGDGSLESPYSTIQKGIDTASDGDTVFVYAGTYVENINFIGKNIAVIGEDKETTIIDGNEEGSVVKFVSGEDENAKIRAFTLSNGSGSDIIQVFDIPDTPGLDTSIVSGVGGGIQLLDSSPKIEDLIITNNKAALGAGLGLYNSSPHIYNVLISNNISYPTLFGQMTAGGGLFLIFSSPTIDYSIITNNNGSLVGGGLIAGGNSSPTITHSNFVNNSAMAGNEIFTGFDDEPAFSNGSGIVTITNSVIYNDRIFDDSDDNIMDTTYIYHDIIGNPNITYSFVSDGYEGEGNLDTIPYFCDLDSGDLTLASNSPLLGSGENGSDIGALGVGCDPITASLEHGKIVPKEFILYQNYPNPFNPFTTVRYALPENGFINITIYDMVGRVVKTLRNGYQTAGFQKIQWNATNNRNEPVSTGLYLFTIQAGEFRRTKKMVLVK